MPWGGSLHVDIRRLSARSLPCSCARTDCPSQRCRPAEALATGHAAHIHETLRRWSIQRWPCRLCRRPVERTRSSSSCTNARKVRHRSRVGRLLLDLAAASCSFLHRIRREKRVSTGRVRVDRPAIVGVVLSHRVGLVHSLVATFFISQTQANRSVVDGHQTTVFFQGVAHLCQC